MPFEIPESWCWTTVSAISRSILYGVSESAKACGKYRLLRSTDIQNNNVQWNNVPYTDFDSNKAESYLLNDGDILFARTGATVGKSYLVQGLTEKAIYASYLIRVQTYDAVLPQYIKFYFESGYYWEQIEQESVGVGQPNVNGSILGNLQIPIPPIHEQNRIVLELTRWKDIIDAIEDGTIELESYVKQTKSKILDLAISGKLVPQDPNDEPAIELLKRINPDFQPCDNSHYGNLPQGWAIVGLHSVAEIITGSTPSKLNAEYYNGDVPFYKPNDLDQGRHVRCASEYLSQQGKSISRSIPCNSIAVCCIGSIGKCGFIEKEGVTNQQINTIVPNDAIFPLYMYYFCNSSTFIDELKSLSSAVTISIVNKSKLSTIQIPLPPIAEQKRIISVIEKLYSHLDMITAEL